MIINSHTYSIFPRCADNRLVHTDMKVRFFKEIILQIVKEGACKIQQDFSSLKQKRCRFYAEKQIVIYLSASLILENFLFYSEFIAEQLIETKIFLSCIYAKIDSTAVSPNLTGKLY